MSTINSYSDIFRKDKITNKFVDIDKTIYVQEVQLTAANLIAMRTTPVVVVPAVAGHVLDFVGAVCVFDYNSVQFTGGGSVSFVEQTSGTGLSGSIADTVIKAAANSITKVLPVAATLTENKGICITNGTAAFAAGNSVMRVKVAYRRYATGL
jgi:hypothetical protein